MSSDVRTDAPPSRYIRGGDVLAPLEAPAAVGPVVAGHLDGQRTQVDAQRRPTRGDPDPALLVAVAELHSPAVDQQQPGGHRAGAHRGKMTPASSGTPPAASLWTPPAGEHLTG